MYVAVPVMVVFERTPLTYAFSVGAGVPVTSPKLYTAGSTDDLRQALMYISYSYPHAPLLGLGFSIGANKLTRYLAEEGENSRLLSACILSNVSV
jgi:predicted alpha/beta-fold hydrolase